MPQHRRYLVRIHRADADETGYRVEVPALPGCFTQGETVEECLERAEEAVRGHVAALVEAGLPVPEEPTAGEDGVLATFVRVEERVA